MIHSHITSPTWVYFGEDALHWVWVSVPASARLSRAVAVWTKVKVVAHETLVAIPRESTFTTSVTADTWGGGSVRLSQAQNRSIVKDSIIVRPL